MAPQLVSSSTQHFGFSRRSSLRRLCILTLLLLGWAATTSAQTSSDFSVALSTGGQPSTVRPGEPTVLRILLQNDSTAGALTNVSYTGSLPSSGAASLVIDGPGSPFAISGGAGCVGTVTAPEDGQGVSFSAVTVPVAPSSSTAASCFFDLPVRATSSDGSAPSLEFAIAATEVSFASGSNGSGGSQTIALLPVQQPTIAKAFSPNNLHVLGGATRTLRITINNPDPAITLTNAGLVDDFPTSGGTSIIEAFGTPTTTDCGVSVAVDISNPERVLVSGASVSPGGSCVIDVQTRAVTTDNAYQQNLTNRIQADSLTNDQGLFAAADATSNVRARSPLAVQKAFNPAVLASGTQGTFTVTLTNNSGSPLPITSFTDNPMSVEDPGRVAIAVPGDVVNSCGGTAVVEGGGTGFSYSGAPAFSIPANDACTISVTFTGTTNTPETPVTYTNTVPQGAVISSTPGIVSQLESATVTVADRLRVLKSVTPTNASPGEAVRFDITVENYSAAVLTNVNVTDSFNDGGAGGTLLLGGGFDPTVTGAGCGPVDLTGLSQGDSSVTINMGSVPARTAGPPDVPGTCVLGIWVMTDIGGGSPNTTNQIDAGGVCSEPTGANICNGAASTVASVSTRDPIAFEKTFNGVDAVTLREGIPARMRLEISNAADRIVSGLTFNDTLPDDGPFQQLQVASPANIDTDCGGTVTAVPGTGSVALSAGSVPAFSGGTPGSCYLEVDVVGPAGVYDNTASAAGNRPNADGSTTQFGISTPLTDDAQLTYTASLSPRKVFQPDSAGDGGVVTLGIVLENLDPNQPITGVALTDPLPTGMVVADPANAYTTCAGSPVIDATPGASTLTASGLILLPASECALVADVAVTGTSDWVNVIPAGNITADNGILNTAPVTATVTSVPRLPPVISKNVSPSSIAPGESALLTIQITNPDSEDLTGLDLTDYFTLDGLISGDPNGMRIAAVPRAGTSCTAGVVIASPGGTSVRVSDADLPASGTCEVEVQVTSTTVGTVVNRIPANAISTDQGATNAGAATTSLTTSSNIGVTKLFEPAVVSPGEVTRLRIILLNGEASALTNFSLTDQYPAGVVNAADPNPITNCGVGVLDTPSVDQVRITGGSIAAATGDDASICSIEIDVVAASEGTYTNTIPAGSLTVGGNPVPHPPAEAVLEARERILVNKFFNNLTLDAAPPVFATGTASELPGVEATLTIRLENPNDKALTRVTFTDVLPDGLTLAETPSAVTDCVSGTVSAATFGRELRLTGATLAATGNAGASCTVTANVVSAVPGVYDNEIPAGDVRSFEGIDNNPGTQARLVITEPPTVTKDFSPPVVAPGDPSRLTITLGNDNDADATLSSAFTDALPTDPDAMVIATPPNAATDCTGVLVANAGAAQVTLNTGAVIPAGGCLIEVDVTAPSAGDYANVIPAGALQTDFGVNSEPANAALKISTLGYISGRVFADNQTVPDGQFIPGQSTPIEGNTIELRAGGNCSGALLASLTTDAQGSYLFADLAAGSYSVCQPDQPPATLNSVTTEGTIQTLDASGGTPGVASNPTATTSQITAIELTADTVDANKVSGSPDNNFSEVQPASLSGHVFYDASNDGVFDADEEGIAGVTVTLDGPSGPITTVTDDDGNWSFSNLPPGTYVVTETQPDGWLDGLDSLGTVDGATVGDAAVNDLFSSIVLGPGAEGVDYDFGEIPPSALSVSAAAVCISDVPYVDYAVTDFGAASSPPLTIRWLTPAGRVVAQLTGQPTSGQLLWPGATVDADGVGTGWPGWLFINDDWVEVEDDRRPDLIVELSFNPTGTASVSYPPATPACAAQPPGTFSLGLTDVPTLPRWAMLWLVAGLLLLAFAYRRQMFAVSGK